MSHAGKWIGQVASSATHALANARRTSAVHPILLALGIIGLPALLMVPFTQGNAQIACLCFVGALLLLFICAYIKYMFTDPDRLQSEDYRVQARTLDLIEQKGGELPLSPISVEAIANPRAPALPSTVERTAERTE